MSQTEEPITPDSHPWRTPLPLARDQSRAPSPPNADGVFCYGDYFEAARALFEEQAFKLLRDAFYQQTQQQVRRDDLEEIRIYSEKHGAFYHPARVVVTAGCQKTSFVLNIAISEAGKAHLIDECRHLERLTQTFPYAYVPRIYGQGQVKTKKIGNIGVFLGKWFEGYHEFHLSLDPANRRQRIRVWDGAQQEFYLSDHQTRALYREAARILTSYYNPETFEQITTWHHGAGDFVVKTKGGHTKLKLVTVRRYESLFKDMDRPTGVNPSTELILQALLVFLIRLSIKMRLDRCDGVGEILWADDISVYGVLAGFFDALVAKPDLPGLPAAIDTCFRYYLSSCTARDLLDLSQAITSKLDPFDLDISVIKKHLERHIETLFECLRQLTCGFEQSG